MKAGGAAAVLLLGASTISAEPFATRDQNPLLAGFGLPSPLPARIEPRESDSARWSIAADLNWASTALVQTSARETLIVDAESRELRIAVQRSLSPQTALRIAAPWRYTGGGSLDSFIDDWHQWFDLPEGARPALPRDRLRIAYARDQTTRLDSRYAGHGLGDVSIGVGHQVLSTEPAALAAWLTLELPTGDADKFNGSGAVDASLALAGDARLAQRWTAFAQAGVSWLGDGDIFPDLQRNVVWSALVGVGWRATPLIELKAQVDAHSAAFDSRLDFLGDSVAVTIGGALHLRSGWRVDIGVTEDIAVETAPDVVFILGLRRGSVR